MTRRKVRNLSAVFFVGLFLLSSEPVFIWLLVGAMVLLHQEEESTKSVKLGKDTVLQASEDARKFGLKMPKQTVLRSQLVQVYKNFDRSKKDYPHLKNEYKEVLNEMWASLAADDSSDHWNRVISSVLAGWPKQQPTVKSSIQSQLKKVTELTQQWDDAKKEVYGGSSV